MWGAVAVLVASLVIRIVVGQSPAQAPSVALGESIPVVNIPARIELPKLPVLENNVKLTMSAVRITVSVTVCFRSAVTGIFQVIEHAIRADVSLLF